MENNINQNFAILQQMRKKEKSPTKKQSGGVKCKRCGANESKFINNISSGDVVCSNCGLIQSERRAEHQNAQVKNRNKQVLFARVIVEEDQKIKLLVNSFFNIIFGDLRLETSAGATIAHTYREIKKFRAKYITKGNIQSAFKGLHMPSIVCCILYCTLIQEKRGMPLSIIVSVMNEALSKSISNTTPVHLQRVYAYRTQQKYGFASFFKNTNMQCYNYSLSPSDFVTFTCNAILRIQDKVIHKMIKKVGDELFKEYPDRMSPAYIATGVLYYFAEKLDVGNLKMFGLKKKESQSKVSI